MTAVRAAEAKFTITYDGPAVQAGRMDAQALGSAILSMARLLETAAALTFEATANVEVDVVADFRQGSFSFDVVDAGALSREILESIDMGHLLAILGLTGGGGLIGLIRWLRNRKMRTLERAADNSMRVVTEDGDSTAIQAQTVILLQNSSVRMHLDGVVAPLRKEGINEFRSGRGAVAETVVTKDEVDYFDPPLPSGEVLQDKTSLEIVQLVSISFLPGRRWRFQLPDGTAFNSSLDDEFTKKVLRHEVVFGAGDALEVDLHIVVFRDPSGPLRAQREIARVHRLIPAPRQLDLGLGELPPTNVQ